MPTSILPVSSTGVRSATLAKCSAVGFPAKPQPGTNVKEYADTMQDRNWGTQKTRFLIKWR